VLQTLVKLDVVAEWITSVPHHLSLLGCGPIHTMLLAQNVKRFQSCKHLLVHNIVIETLVPQR
jgi:hypothetical protein